MGRDRPVRDRFEQAGVDLLYGLRQLRTNPSFAAVGVLTLALGIGVNTAMFGVVRSLLSRAAAFPDLDRLVLIDAFAGPVPGAGDRGRLREPRQPARRFHQMAAFDIVGRTLTGAGEPLTVNAVRCTARFTPMLGLRPVAGRLPQQHEYAAGSEPVVAITDRLWARAFDRDSAVVGRVVTIDGVAHTIVGVLPLSAALETLAYAAFDVLMPLRFGEKAADGSPASLRVIARLADGVTVERQSAAMAAIPAGDAPLDRAASTPKAFRLQPLEEFLVPVGMRVMMAGLLAAVAVVLLVACLNLASVSAARTAARSQELAIRAALGANAGRILRQLVAENLLLAVSGGALGVIAVSGRCVCSALSPTRRSTSPRRCGLTRRCSATASCCACWQPWHSACCRPRSRPGLRPAQACVRTRALPEAAASTAGSGLLSSSPNWRSACRSWSR